MVKVVYNGCYGGFSLSKKAIERYAELKGTSDELGEGRDIARSDPALVQVVEEMGEDANGRCAYLVIDELTEGTRYRIDEYDGMEAIMTIDDYEWSVA